MLPRASHVPRFAGRSWSALGTSAGVALAVAVDSRQHSALEFFFGFLKALFQRTKRLLFGGKYARTGGKVLRNTSLLFFGACVPALTGLGEGDREWEHMVSTARTSFMDEETERGGDADEPYSEGAPFSCGTSEGSRIWCNRTDTMGIIMAAMALWVEKHSWIDSVAGG